MLIEIIKALFWGVLIFIFVMILMWISLIFVPIGY